MELQATPRAAVERCPYCHDVIVGAAGLDSELITCAGCGTQHHEACLLELGRCTIRGCERELVVVRTPEVEARLASRSPFYREVHRRISARARAFVRSNCKPPSEGLPFRFDFDARDVTLIRETLLSGHRARQDRRWEEAAASFEEAERLIRSLPALASSDQLCTTAAEAHAYAVAARNQNDGESLVPRILLGVLVVFVVVMAASIFFR